MRCSDCRPRPKPTNHNVPLSNPDSMASYYSDRGQR